MIRLLSLFVFSLILGACGGSSSSSNNEAPIPPNSSAQDQNPGSEASNPQFFNTNGIAIRGSDPVAYFTEAQAVSGSSEISYQWRGVTWQFASEANRQQFVDNPENFAPQYGGYCAYAVSLGSTASIIPEAWSIHEGKLYLNQSLPIRSRWEQDIPGHVARADANWPRLSGN